MEVVMPTMPKLRFLSVLLFLCQSAMPAMAVPVDPPVLKSDAAIPWQWIGLQKDADGACPSPDSGGWIVEKLFAPVPGGGLANIPPALRPFCLYSQPSPGPVTAGALAALAALEPQQLRDLEMDSLSVTTAGILEQALRHDLEQHFLDQAGANFRNLPSASAATHLAVVDTARTDHHKAYLNTGTSPHGYTLINLARALLCQGDRCAAKITSRLAMPFHVIDSGSSTRVLRDLRHGGTFGSVAELARGLQHEVAHWAASGSDGRLILNLSLGWDPVFGGGESTVAAMPLSVQAVFRAIADARCRGGLIIAAAGNDPGGPWTTGPIFPAAWEQLPAPKRTACTTALGFAPSPSHFPTAATAYNPLVFAASGVQSAGQPLANQRPGAGAPIAAYADHATAPGARPSAPTALLTGSSVASLVTSSAAALVWHRLPKLRADEVMAHLYSAGDDLGRRPDFAMRSSTSSGRSSVRRVSLCSAQHRACSLAGSCPGPPIPCPAWDPEPLNLPSTLRLTLAEDIGEIDLSSIKVEQKLSKACRYRTFKLRKDDSMPSDPCPDRQYRESRAAPWRTDPQPGSNFCPSCPLNESTSTLLLETDSSDPSAVWQDPVLVLCGDTYDLGIDELAAGDVFEVTGVSLGSCRKAWLTATTEDGSVISPLLIGTS